MAANVNNSHYVQTAHDIFKDVHNTCIISQLFQNQYRLNQVIKRSLPKLPSFKEFSNVLHEVVTKIWPNMRFCKMFKKSRSYVKTNGTIGFLDLKNIDKLTCRPKKRSADKFDSFDPSYCQFLIKL